MHNDSEQLAKPVEVEGAEVAQRNRARFSEAGVFALNILASPGSGKTSTILAVIDALRDEFNIAVIEGDLASRVDTERINEQGIAAVQVDTGNARHLDARMVACALEELDLANLDLVLLENAGNLELPEGFDLGESAKVTMLSVPEGHDKPAMHPGIFRVCDAVVLNKVDTMPSHDFDQAAFRATMSRLNPGVPLFPLSATTGLGVEEFAEWIASQVRALQ